MANREQFQKEVDTYLEEITLTDEMKSNIRRACYEQRTERSKMPHAYRRALGIAGAFLVASTSIMAVGVSNNWHLGMFFDQESVNSVANDIQDVKKFDERKNVKMEIEEVVNQGHGAVVVVKFINLGEERWTQNIACKKFELLIDNKLTDRYISTSDGVLSQDGKELTYCVNIQSEKNVLDEHDIELDASNLVNYETFEKEVNVPLDKCVIADLSKNRQVSMDRVLCDNYAKGAKGNIIPTLHKDYPQVQVLGIGIETGEDDSREEGIYIRTSSDEYGDFYDEDEDAYFRGGVIEVKDTRTNKVYGCKTWKGSYSIWNLDCKFFPGIKREQIPYLVATKALFERQQVDTYTTWQVAFNIDKNMSNICWQPKLKIDGMDKYGCSIDIEEVSLTSAGIHIVGREKGQYDSRLLKVSLVNEKDQSIELIDRYYSSGKDEEGNYGYCIMDFEPKDMKATELLNTKEIKEVIINDHVLKVEK